MHTEESRVLLAIWDGAVREFKQRNLELKWVYTDEWIACTNNMRLVEPMAVAYGG